MYSPEEAMRKKELRLMKNRQAAREYRRRKNKYVRSLEKRAAILETMNKMLMEELEKYRQAYPPVV